VRVLVTRPAAAAAALAARLAARGHEVTIEPLLAIVRDPDSGDSLARALEGAQAALFTSANGVDAFAAASLRRDLPAYAVGDASASAARAAGFSAVESAGGDVASLASLVAARLKPGDGPLVHGCGHDVAGDLAGTLAGKRFVVRPVALYRAEAATALSPAAVAALRSGRLDAALFFSPRTTGTFVRLAAAAGVQAACAGMAAVVLSPAVAAALSPLTWQRVAVAGEPTETALLEALERLAIAPAGKRDH
jgi:uroporphyrinogen-III synthase